MRLALLLLLCGSAQGQLVTSQTDVTASRSLGTVFHNTGSSPIFVTAYSTTTGTGTLFLRTDSAATPTTTVSADSSSTGFRFVFGVVCPGNFYLVNNDNGTSNLTKWYESSGSGSISCTQSTPVRVFGTVYQNTNASVLVVAAGHGGNVGTVTGLTGATSSPATSVAVQTAPGAYAKLVYFLVPQNWFYQVTVDSAVAGQIWTEWDFSDSTPWVQASPARSGNTTYTNSNTQGIFVGLVRNGVSQGSILGYTDSSTPPTSLVVAQSGQLSNFSSDALMPVASGNNYLANADNGGSIGVWVEWSAAPNMGPSTILGGQSFLSGASKVK